MAWSCTSPVRQSANNSTLDVSPSSVKLPAIARGDCHPSPSLYRVKDPKTLPTPVSRVSQQFNSTTSAVVALIQTVAFNQDHPFGRLYNNCLQHPQERAMGVFCLWQKTRLKRSALNSPAPTHRFRWARLDSN